MYKQLMPLKIPSGWGVFQNRFGDEDPVVQEGLIVNDIYYDEDLLWIEHLEMGPDGWRQSKLSHVIDLGWYPAASPQGRYSLVLFKSERENEIFTYKTRDRYLVRDVIHRSIELILNGVSEKEIAETIDQEFGTTNELR
jgi:hypothetical protein